MKIEFTTYGAGFIHGFVLCMVIMTFLSQFGFGRAEKRGYERAKKEIEEEPDPSKKGESRASRGRIGA